MAGRRMAGVLMMLAGGPLAAQDAIPGAGPDRVEEGLSHEGDAMAPVPPTRVLSEPDAVRLRGLDGMTLQWISWDKRGTASVTIDPNGVWRIYGEQSGAGDAGVEVDGTITEIGADYFEIEGAITIANTPDEGRTCEAYGSWRFAVTQNRRYYRLRQFEWCDGLTDYIDFYF